MKRVIIRCHDTEIKFRFPDDISDLIIIDSSYIHEVRQSRKNPRWFYHHEKSCKYEWLTSELSYRTQEKLGRMLDIINMWITRENIRDKLNVPQREYYYPILMIDLKKKKCYLVWRSKEIFYWNTTFGFSVSGTKLAFYRILHEIPIVDISVELK